MKPSSISKTFVFLSLIFLTVTTLAGGPGTVPPLTAGITAAPPEPIQTGIGDVYISFTGIRALDEIVDNLQPSFQITPQMALQMAVPDTKSTLESTLNAISTSLQVGFASNPSANVASNPVPASAAAQPVPGSLTNVTGASFGMDPVSEYQAAASLFQQVQLLNQSLKDAPRFKGYDAYIVTVQVTLVPYRRNAPYDAYADLSFFCDTNDPSIQPLQTDESIPLVFPVLTSDQLEEASDQQSINELSSISLALSVAYHNVGVQAALSQLNQNLNQIMGNNLNSLLTIGKITQNTVAIRLGARNSTTTNGVTMLPEPHTIAFLVLARRDANELEMISQTAFRDGANGKKLPFPLDDWARQVSDQFNDRIFGGYLNLTPEEEHGMWRSQEAKLNRKYFELDLMNDVNSATNISTAFTNFCSCFQSYCTDPANFDRSYIQHNKDVMSQIKETINHFGIIDYNSLWLDVTKIQASPFENDLIGLPHWKPGLPATDQAVIYTDDGQSTTFTLNVGKEISSAASKMTAVLTLTDAPPAEVAPAAVAPAAKAPPAKVPVVKAPDPVTKTNILYSDQIQNNGNDVKVVFPAISAMSGVITNISSLSLVLETNDDSYTTNFYDAFVTLKKQTNSLPPPWSIVRTYGVLTAGMSNQLSIVLQTNSVNTNYTTYYLDIENPQVLSYTNYGVFSSYINGVYQLAVTNNYLATFTFGTLLTGQTITFNLLDQNQKFVATLNTQTVYPPNSTQTASSQSQGGGGASH